MKKSVALAKEADAKKGFSSIRSSEEGIHRQHEPEKLISSLGV